MTLISCVPAWSVLENIASDDWENFSDLIHIIIDNHYEDAIDDVVNDEFPNGTDEDKLREFFLHNQKKILKKLGYSGLDN